MQTLQEKYKKEIVPALQKQLGLTNALQVPKITRITLNVGIGRSLKDPNVIPLVEGSLTRISGQKPIRTKAKKSVASFKIREGQVIGLAVSLRKKRMQDFLEKLIMFALPRVRDFRGIDMKAVDKQGNMTIGFKENLMFPEIHSDEIERTHGLEVCISTSAQNREAGLALFQMYGFPFKKDSK